MDDVKYTRQWKTTLERKDDPQFYEHSFASNEARANPRMDDDICWLSLLLVLLFVREVSISDHSGVFLCSPQKPKFPNCFSIWFDQERLRSVARITIIIII